MQKNFGDDSNKVLSTVADTWTRIGSATLPTFFSSLRRGWVIDFQGVYWDGSATKDLKIRDAYGNEIYHAVSDGAAVVDLLASPLTVRLPLEYLTDEADKVIMVYGKVLS